MIVVITIIGRLFPFFFFFDFIFEGISKLEELSRKTDVEIE